MPQLNNQHAIISGGGSGVGAEIAKTFADAGAKVTILGRREAPLKELANTHPDIGWQVCDVTDQTALRDAYARSTDQFGPATLAIANAGAALSKPFVSTTPDDLRKMLVINLIGVANLFQSALPDMKAHGGGRMVAIASLAGLKGYQYVSGYVAAKHAVVGLCRSLALEFARDNITVNAICPGFIETPLLERSVENIKAKTGMSEEDARKSLMSGNPQKRFIQTDEVAGTALWLCSKAARSVNGQAITISGGES